MKEDLSFDVVIIGGGPAGALAAIASARHGASTLIVEQAGFLGGMLTTAGTGPQMSYHAGSVQVIRGIAAELVDRLVEAGYSPGHMEDFAGYTSSVTPFDSEGLKCVLEEMVQKAGARILYHTICTGLEMEGDRIGLVHLFSKSGFFDVKGKIFIDCSADADLAVYAGIPYEYGDDETNIAQPMTLNLKMGGVDREKVIEFVRNNQEDMLPTVPFGNLHMIPRTGIQGAYKEIEKAKKNEEFHIGRKDVLCFETNHMGEFIINMSRVTDLCSIDPFDLTQAEIEGRKQTKEIAAFMKKYIPGFENSYILSTGPSIGIRESRRIRGLYYLTGEDLIRNVMFPDAVVMGGYPIDVHSKNNSFPSERYQLKNGSWYSIPYRCFVSDKVDNYLAAGRCISTDHAACGAVRVTPIVMAMGQAVGTAAALCSKENIKTRDIDINLLRCVLKADGVFLEEYRQE